MKEYSTRYTELGPELQQKIRKAYPMVLSETWPVIYHPIPFLSIRLMIFSTDFPVLKSSAGVFLQ
jgi:hypothetical protein